ncbi:MAG: hypothetical protein PHX27_01000 [Candidatus ainarchaeum sp.]|nr:hypothetical protein [Candidatus ainarchaeum sp.]
MDLGKSINEIFKFSLIDFLKIKKLKKYLIIITIIYLIFFLGYLGLINYFSTSIIENQPIDFIQTIVNFVLLIIIISMPISLIIVFFEYKITQEILNTKKIKTKKLDLIQYIKFLLMPLIIFLTASLSLFKIKFLLIGIISIAVLSIGIFTILTNLALGSILILIGFLMGLLYFAIISYQLIRLSLSQISIVQTGEIKKALNESWNITKNNILNIIVIQVVFFTIIYVITLIFTMPLTAYSTLTAITPPAIEQAETLGLNLMFDPTYNLLMTPLYLIAGYLLIIQLNVTTMLYLILNNNKTHFIKKSTKKIKKKIIS